MKLISIPYETEDQKDAIIFHVLNYLEQHIEFSDCWITTDYEELGRIQNREEVILPIRYNYADDTE